MHNNRGSYCLHIWLSSTGYIYQQFWSSLCRLLQHEEIYTGTLCPSISRAPKVLMVFRIADEVERGATFDRPRSVEGRGLRSKRWRSSSRLWWKKWHVSLPRRPTSYFSHWMTPHYTLCHRRRLSSMACPAACSPFVCPGTCSSSKLKAPPRRLGYFIFSPRRLSYQVSIMNTMFALEEPCVLDGNPIHDF